LSQLRRELLSPHPYLPNQRPRRDQSMAAPNELATEDNPMVGEIPLEHQNPPQPSPVSPLPKSISLPNQNSVNTRSTTSNARYIVEIDLSPKYFEDCVNIGNYAISHHDIDISHVTSDGELFEMIWERYNSSRGVGLRRLFLQPKNVHFVMVSVLHAIQMVYSLEANS
jgi:hypothetical protein